MSTSAQTTPSAMAEAVVELQQLLTERFDEMTAPDGSTLTGARGVVPAPVVVTLGAEDTLAAGSAQAERHARATVHLTAHTVLFGPWSAPLGDGTADGAGPACGQCLAQRWQRLRPRYEREALEFGTGLRAAGSWPLVTPFVADAVWSGYLASLNTASAHGPQGHPAGSRVTMMDLGTLMLRTYPLVADPLCPACVPAVPETAAHAPRPLTSRTKPAPDTYRLRRPADYRLSPGALTNPACGVLGAATTMSVTSPTTAPVSGQVLAPGYYGLADMSWSGQANSYGLSRDLAFLEGLERYAGIERRRRTVLPVAAYQDVATDALDPRECGVYSPKTYELDDALAPFDPAAEIPWVWGRSLRDDRPVMVPARLVHYGSGSLVDNFVFESSNGCAGGGSLEEAVLFGLLELVERDAFVLGWYGGADLTEIDISDTADPQLRAMLDRAAFLGYDVKVFDNRLDLRIPVVTGVAIRRDGGDGALSFAAAAGLAPEAAVLGAVSEILTYIPALPGRIAERRDEVQAMTDDYYKVRELRDHSALFSLPEMRVHARRYIEPAAVRPFEEVYDGWSRERPRTRDLLDDLRFCQDELTAAGYDVIVVDQTSAEQRALGLHTACTIVPGLLPIDFGWARQRALRMPRMFSALRRAGLRTSDLTEADLHRVPHPFP
ncbi:TOMM precursor leader peptide-binding protein [Streptomyces sp. GbtcB7]|uniref:TOMM precursor leader peptide-binding protein n=1 Tax=Streptomyces sp. GbtcB7 TaxID=2824752 RepID=UPI001C2F3202|nr:TOMM precursor leader peptide-binding protein [Streptomyces sp. GbtcB7]